MIQQLPPAKSLSIYYQYHWKKVTWEVIHSGHWLSVVHLYLGIWASYVLNIFITSFHMRLSLGKLLLTKVSWNSLTCLTPQSTFHLSTWVSPKIMATVLNSPMLYGDTLYWNLFVRKPCSFLVWRKIKYNLLPFLTFTSILCCSRISTCLTIDKPTGTLQIMILYYTEQTKSKSKTIKSKLWGVENPRSILKCCLLLKYLQEF